MTGCLIARVRWYRCKSRICNFKDFFQDPWDWMCNNDSPTRMSIKQSKKTSSYWKTYLQNWLLYWGQKNRHNSCHTKIVQNGKSLDNWKYPALKLLSLAWGSQVSKDKKLLGICHASKISSEQLKQSTIDNLRISSCHKKIVDNNYNLKNHVAVTISLATLHTSTATKQTLFLPIASICFFARKNQSTLLLVFFCCQMFLSKIML